MEDDRASELRKLPQVDKVAGALGSGPPHALRVRASRQAILSAKRAVENGEAAPSLEAIINAAASALMADVSSRLRPVINATGVLLHTNLGRAPLSASAIKAVAEVASGYSNLEYDLSTGKRGSRYRHATDLIELLTRAEASLVVNNNAAAVMLVLATLCKDREVIVSRGELVEIGGEFRIPDIMRASGAILREVGTTNRTHLRDYVEAIGPQTAAIMKVHPSNYKVIGFSASVSGAQLGALASEHEVLFIHDLGSGRLEKGSGGVLHDEPSVEAALEDGADIVTFSGDKLLGGPQAGVILGRTEPIGGLMRSPLLRALRVDKMTLAALEATLLLYLDGASPEIPIWAMAAQTVIDIETRARNLVEHLGPLSSKVDLVDGVSTAGGGAGASSDLPTVLIEIRSADLSVDAMFTKLLQGDPPIVSRIADDRLLIDLRTVSPEHDTTIIEALRSAIE